MGDWNASIGKGKEGKVEKPSVTSHASKILTKIIHRKIEQSVEENLGEDQFGFRRNRGTREAILSLTF